jgi:hypothetical protein
MNALQRLFTDKLVDNSKKDLLFSFHLPSFLFGKDDLFGFFLPQMIFYLQLTVVRNGVVWNGVTKAICDQLIE